MENITCLFCFYKNGAPLGNTGFPQELSEGKVRQRKVQKNCLSQGLEAVKVNRKEKSTPLFEKIEYNLFRITLLLLFVAGLVRIIRTELGW